MRVRHTGRLLGVMAVVGVAVGLGVAGLVMFLASDRAAASKATPKDPAEAVVPNELTLGAMLAGEDLHCAYQALGKRYRSDRETIKKLLHKRQESEGLSVGEAELLLIDIEAAKERCRQTVNAMFLLGIKLEIEAAKTPEPEEQAKP